MGELINALAGEAKGLVVTGYQDLLQPSMQEAGKALATTMQFVCTPFTALQHVNDVVKANLRRAGECCGAGFSADRVLMLITNERIRE